jgi:cell division protein ZapA (FtsZ GTPase activity inhibitor)
MEARLENRDVNSDENTMLMRRDNSCVPVEYTATALCDEQANVMGAVLVIRDASQRKARENEMRDSNRSLETTNQQLQAMVNASSRRTGSPLDEY